MDQQPQPEGFTLVQALWVATALLGLFWGLLLGLLGWVFRMVWARIVDLGKRLHKVEGEQAAQGPMVSELWVAKREREKEKE